MAGMTDKRVAIVTGAGRGLGRAHALELAAHGAIVVVNDVGSGLDGLGASSDPADEVVATIEAGGGQAIVDRNDISTWAGAEALITSAVEICGRLDVVVNNAGVIRDRMLANLTEAEWQAVISVHLSGTAAVTRFAGAHWRDEAKADRMPDARIINTTSAAGLYGNAGQTSYSAAKAGIVGITLTAAVEFGRYGITVNAIAPAARTRMTEGIPSSAEVSDGFDAMDPANNSPLVAWLASPASAGITGRVFEVGGGYIGIANGWSHGPHVEIKRQWTIAELEELVPDLVNQAPKPTPCFPVPGVPTNP